MKTADLMEQRAAIVDRMNAAHSTDDDTAFQTAETELRAIDAKLERAKKIDAADRAAPGKPLTGTTDDHLSRELRGFSVRKLIAHAAGMNVDAGRELEMQAELERRAGKPAQGFYIPTEAFEKRVNLTTTASEIVPDDYRPEMFVSALTNSAAIVGLGATTLSGLTGDVVIPMEGDSPQVGWVNENETLPEDDATFADMRLTPHHVGAITSMSRQLVQQSSPGIEGLLRQMLSRNIALEIDRAAISGTGTGAEPAGILNTPGIQTQAFTADLFTTTAMMIARADTANVTASGFLATNGVKLSAMLQREDGGRGIPVGESFHGEPVRFSNQLPNNLGVGDDEHALIYGNWSDLLIGLWSQLDILVNPYEGVAYRKGNVLIRAMATVDFGLRRPSSFVAATGVTGQ